MPLNENEIKHIQFNKRSGTQNIHGLNYEIKLLMILYLNGIIKIINKEWTNFKIAANVENAGDFDDIVLKFEYLEEGIKKNKIYFIQTKHKLSPTELIDDVSLFETAKPFNIPKYFKSYKAIILKFIDPYHPIFGENVENCEFFILTNVKSERPQIELSETELLNFNGTSQYLEFHSKELIEKINNESDTETIDKFNKQFRFLTGQPSEKELDEPIINCIKEIIKSQTLCRHPEDIFNELKRNIEDWKNGTEHFCRYLTPNDQLFRNCNYSDTRFELNSPCPSFSGRAMELDKLHSLLQKHRVALISGLPGVGKTQLVKKYVLQENTTGKHKNIIFIQANDENQLQQSIELLKNKYLMNLKFCGGEEMTSKSIQDHLTLLNKILEHFKKEQTILIFDDLNQHFISHMAEANLLTPTNNLSIILTSCENILHESIDTLQLQELTENDAKDMIKSEIGDTQDQKVEELIKFCKNFPLTLQQTISKIKKWNKDFGIEGNKLHIFEEKLTITQDEILNAPFISEVFNYTKTTVSAIEGLLKKMENMEYGKLASEILCLSVYTNNNQQLNIDLFKSEKNRRAALNLLLSFSFIKDELIADIVVSVIQILNERNKDQLNKKIKARESDNSRIAKSKL